MNSTSSSDPERSGLSVERLIADGLVTDSMSGDQIREWIVNEQTCQGRRTKACWSATLMICLAITGIGWMLSVEAAQVRQLVGEQRSLSLIQLEQTTREICHAAPAEYFIRQLGGQHSTSQISSSQ